MKSKVYLSIGGNLGDPISTVSRVLNEISLLSGVESFQAARLYETSPVSPIKQNRFINTACSFFYDESLSTLWNTLQDIEKRHGKVEKQKDAPRLIDIDVIFFGQNRYTDPIEVPHPRFQDRLFVLVPLRELTNEIIIGNETIVIDRLLDGIFPGQQIQTLEESACPL